jgi:hypothetical protein
LQYINRQTDLQLEEIGMSDTQSKKKLTGPWHSLHVVIWLIGIYILASHNWWWPGILVLVAISGLYEAFLQRFIPEAYVEERPAIPATPGMSPNPISTTAMPSPAPLVQEHRSELLPQVCPGCNAPVRGHEVRWTGAQSANCAYCGTNLPMNKT